MHAPERIGRAAAAILSQPGRLHGTAATAAVLVCAAIVLNVGPFAGGTSLDGARGAARVAARDVTTQGSVRSLAARQEDAAPAPAPASAQAEPAAAPGEAEIRTAALSLDDIAAGAPLPIHPARPEPMGDTIVGIWAPDAATCSLRNFRDGTLPTVINADGAWAGDTFCLFVKREKMPTGWRVRAKCSNPRESWTSTVRLSRSDNRLTWASQRGTQVYTRCEADVLMAEAK